MRLGEWWLKAIAVTPQRCGEKGLKESSGITDEKGVGVSEHWAVRRKGRGETLWVQIAVIRGLVIMVPRMGTQGEEGDTFLEMLGLRWLWICRWKSSSNTI